MVSAVHPGNAPVESVAYPASKGLHMVSAVHLCSEVPILANLMASKGLHMVSAVHRVDSSEAEFNSAYASKGLHMVSAVHLEIGCLLALKDLRLQRGCTWLVQFIQYGSVSTLEFP